MEEKVLRDSSMTMVDNSMIFFECGREGFERFLDHVVENSMISLEREGSRVLSFEKFLDDGG